MHLPTSQPDCQQEREAILADFIREQAEAIIARWMSVSYADSCVVREANLSRFHDEVKALLDAVAEAVRGEGQGGRCASQAASLSLCAERFAIDHLKSGLNEVELVLTLQALRKVVVQQWMESLRDSDMQVLEALAKLNQVFDNALAAAVDHYCRLKERCHGLFLKTLAHDLRNPLGGLELTTQVLRQTPMNGGDAMHKLTVSMSRSVDCAMRVAGDMYDIGTMHDGLGIVINPVRVDAAALCRKLVDELMSRHPGLAIQLHASGPLIGMLDEARVEQAFCNIIGYALRHAEKAVPLSVKMDADAASLLFSVSFTTNGHVTAEPEGLFAPMRRYAVHVLSKKGPIPELGIDLYLAREIIHAHEGEIDFRSESKVQTFEARLPRAPELTQ